MAGNLNDAQRLALNDFARTQPTLRNAFDYTLDQGVPGVAAPPSNGLGDRLSEGGSADSLGDLSDVTISGTPADNEILGYDSGTGEWINQTAAELGISVDSLDDIGDVTITSVGAGELIKWNGSAWINNTLAEAGIAEASHNHAAGDINSGTFADARIAESNVTQHQAALSITESQISDLAHKTDLDSLNDVTITSATANDFLRFNGSAWVDFALFATANSWSDQQTFTAGGILLQDNINLTLGTGSDATLDYNGTNLVLDVTGDLIINTGDLDMNENNILNANIVSGGTATTDTLELHAYDGGQDPQGTGVIDIHAPLTFSDDMDDSVSGITSFNYITVDSVLDMTTQTSVNSKQYVGFKFEPRLDYNFISGLSLMPTFDRDWETGSKVI